MDVFAILWQLVLNLFDLLVATLRLGLQWWLLIAWFSWWTFAVDWRRAWGYLGQGAWAPLVLLALVGAFVWSRLDPGPCNCLGFMTVPTFWWHLGGVGLVLAATFLCGWVQGLIGWVPPEIDLEPPAHAEHGHAHH